MNVNQPTAVDPCKEPDEVYQLVRQGRLNVYCDNCGMLGRNDNWRTVDRGGSYLKQCPICRETVVRPLRETGPGSGATGTQGTTL